jgi:hypothetical protein
VGGIKFPLDKPSKVCYNKYELKEKAHTPSKKVEKIKKNT